VLLEVEGNNGRVVIKIGHPLAVCFLFILRGFRRGWHMLVEIWPLNVHSRNCEEEMGGFAV
jgi:hypothetical protein